MVQFSYVITLISTCFGALTLIFGFSGARSAPQEAAIAALAIALSVIPYIFSRCIQISADRKAQKTMHEEILAALKVHSVKTGPATSSASSPTYNDALAISVKVEPTMSSNAPPVVRTDWQ